MERAGIVAPRLPFLHAAGVLILLAIDTASVLAKGSGPLWFDLAGSSILGLAVLAGGWIIARRRDRPLWFSPLFNPTSGLAY